MLEIFVLVKLCTHLSQKASSKGWPGPLFGGIMAVSWFVCGIAGAVIAFLGSSPNEFDFPIEIFLGYIVGVGFAAMVNTLIVDGLKDNEAERTTHLDRFAAEEQDYIEARRTGRAQPRTAEAEFGEYVPVRTTYAPATDVVPLQSATSTPVPRAKRAWTKKWSSDL